jgi:cephalosporin-C deacetylase-like acetyl esterase
VILFVIFGTTGISLLFFINAIVKLQPSLLVQVKWPVIILSIILNGTYIYLLFKLRRSYGKKLLLISIIATFALGLTLFETTIFYAQGKILFEQPKLTELGKDYITNTFRHIEDITIETKDQIKLKGWMIHNSKEKKSPLIIYFGGNNENVPPSFFNNLNGWDIVFVNYRGYGVSEGIPTETNLKADALIIYDSVSQRKDIDNQQIVIIGRSLGSGVATYIAKEREVSGVVFISPYDSMVHVVEDLFPLFPSRFVINHFNSIDLAASINSPVLSFIGENDNTIRPQRSYSLLSKWSGEKKTRIVQGANHNSILNNDILREDIISFLKDIRRR